MALDSAKLDEALRRADDMGYRDADQPRDQGGRFTSTPGGKTEYTGHTDKLAKEAREKAHEHRRYLESIGHRDTRVTKRHENFTVPGRGPAVMSTYTTHHGFPTK